MQNFIQKGDNLTVLAPYALAAGQGALVGAIFGIATSAAAIGAEVVLVREGVFSHAKVSAQAWAVGDKIYWDNAARNLTTMVGTNTLVGVATAIAVNPTATGEVLLDGCVR
jgi:predicted RecA/RadA family phage recombinase